MLWSESFEDIFELSSPLEWLSSPWEWEQAEGVLKGLGAQLWGAQLFYGLLEMVRLGRRRRPPSKWRNLNKKRETFLKADVNGKVEGK